MNKKLIFNNTYNSGGVTYLILQEKKDKFIGVCLEFDLEIEAKTLEEANAQISDYAHLWLQNTVKNHLPEEVLNRPAPKKYWRIYEGLVKRDLNKLETEKKRETISPQVEVPKRVFRYESPYNNFTFA